MTPPALTPAARATRTAPEAGAAPAKPTRGSGHRSPVGRTTTPRAPRRVSGPASGITRGAATAAPAVPVTRPRRPATRPGRPSRVNGAPRTGRLRRAPLPARAAAVVRGLPDHSLLDRVIRGRAWIPLLGVLLAGIVAMQVEVLKLNAGIGRSLQQSTALQSRNQLLRASVAKLADDQRIESMAAKRGLLMPLPSAVHFVSTAAVNARRAASSIHAPNATAFVAGLPPADTTAGGAGTPGTTGTTATAPAISTAPPASTPAVSTAPSASTPAVSTAPPTSTPAVSTAPPASTPASTTPPASATGTVPASSASSGGGGLVAAGSAAAGTTSTGG